MSCSHKILNVIPMFFNFVIIQMYICRNQRTTSYPRDECIYTYTCKYTYIYIYTYIHTYMYVCMYIYIYIYIHVFLFTYIHIFIYIHAHFLHMCIYVYAHFPNICFNINILIVFEHFMICVFDIFYFGISSPLHFMRKSGDPPYNGICPYATHPTMAS